MSQVNVNILMDESLMNNFEVACRDMGMTITSAFTAFAKSVSCNSEILHRISSPPIAEITLASEKALARDWLRPEEDEAWANL
ncbi:MAG: hypothetical protein LBR22_06010 [Desulfovibrio sp.]|jgi:antitoxin component of RelBE/YafQ-DinJ toxin-antitoxin module|nr:hypothetical protein [Desulfovibrio sp.]